MSRDRHRSRRQGDLGAQLGAATDHLSLQRCEEGLAQHACGPSERRVEISERFVRETEASILQMVAFAGKADMPLYCYGRLPSPQSTLTAVRMRLEWNITERGNSKCRQRSILNWLSSG